MQSRGQGGGGISAAAHWPRLQRTCVVDAASQCSTFLLFQLRALKQCWHMHTSSCAKGIGTCRSATAPSTPSGEGPTLTRMGPSMSQEVAGMEGQPKEVVGDAAHRASAVPSCTNSNRSKSCSLETPQPEAGKESPFQLNARMRTEACLDSPGTQRPRGCQLPPAPPSTAPEPAAQPGSYQKRPAPWVASAMEMGG